MSDINMTRRQILSGGCGLAAAGSIGGCSSQPVSSQPVMGPEKKIASLFDLRSNPLIRFAYPDEEPALLLDLRKRVEGGVGATGSIIAYSGLCQHMGYPLNYEADKKKFVCPLHSSAFNAMLSGNTVEGPSPTKLPRILLKVVEREIYAIGVQGGVIYGRASNNA